MIEVYTRMLCPYCTKAKRLLKAKGVTFTEIDVSNGGEARDIMVERSGRNTAPQIFMNGRHIGGYSDMLALEQEGALDAILADT